MEILLKKEKVNLKENWKGFKLFFC
jgi:hypothetical protein